MNDVFAWKDALATGFDEVDLQHKKLILIIDDVRAALESPPDEYALRMAKDLKRLTDYTEYHFAEEEALMRKNGFPGYDGHKKRHDEFVARVRGHIAALSRQKAADGVDLYRFLGTWLIAHIAQEDRLWATYIRDKK
jgi:hemerythrin-like metal-binding protein